MRDWDGDEGLGQGFGMRDAGFGVGKSLAPPTSYGSSKRSSTGVDSRRPY